MNLFIGSMRLRSLVNDCETLRHILLIGRNVDSSRDEGAVRSYSQNLLLIFVL